MKKKQKHSIIDIEIVIKYANVHASISEDVYDKDDIKTIKDAINVFSREIIIDKTYVAFNDSKYNNTFLAEEGWKTFCELLNKTNCGKNATTEEHDTIQTVYYLMIISYVYLCLSTIGYSSDGIYLEIPQKSLFMVEVRPDTYNEYSRYPGKWQSWKSLS